MPFVKLINYFLWVTLDRHSHPSREAWMGEEGLTKPPILAIIIGVYNVFNGG